MGAAQCVCVCVCVCIARYTEDHISSVITARCSIVDYSGHVILDLYVKPDDNITDYRTPWSGIRPKDMKRAVPFKNARNMIVKAIKVK